MSHTDYDVLALASIFGSTADPLNKNPVTETIVDRAATGSCTSGASDATSNFRSAHEGGGHFLMADGSVHFVGENVSQTVYRNLSEVVNLLI